MTDWATIAAFIVLTFGDQVGTFVWAFYYGPNRARKMIMNDPLFKRLSKSLDNLETESAALRHDFVAMQTLLKGQNEDIKRDVVARVEKALEKVMDKVDRRLETFETRLEGVTKDVHIPADEVSQVVDRVTKSAQRAVNKAVADADFLEPFAELIDEKLESIRPEDVDVVEMLEDGTMDSIEGQQKSYDWLRDKGLPDTVAYSASVKGPKTLRKLAKLKGWDIAELF